MPYFQKKPLVIEAKQLIGEGHDIIHWLDIEGADYAIGRNGDRMYISLKTLNGYVNVEENDWIIKGAAGEFYPCNPVILAETYEEVALNV